MTSLDVNFVRAQFPSLQAGERAPAPMGFFENAGGSFAPQAVIDRWVDYMTYYKAQPYGPYPAALRGAELIEQATICMAEFIGADADEVVLGHSTTLNLAMLALALRPGLQAGDEIIVSQQDHESNVSPWRKLAEFGVVIREWPLDPATGLLSLETLQGLLNSKTRWVCFPHSSNVIGAVNEVAAVVRMAHAAGARVLVDGVSYAPHHSVDVKALGVDAYACSLYKVFGPHLGLLYVRRELHDTLANQSLEFLPALYRKFTQPGAPNDLRVKLNPGLVNHEEAVAALGIADYFDALYAHHFQAQETAFGQRVKAVFGLIQQHEAELSRAWIAYIAQRPHLGLIGPASHDTGRRSPTWSLRVDGYEPLAIGRALGERGFGVQAGSFYAWRCLQALGIDPARGVLRISAAHFNTVEEITALGETLDELCPEATQ